MQTDVSISPLGFMGLVIACLLVGRAILGISERVYGWRHRHDPIDAEFSGNGTIIGYKVLDVWNLGFVQSPFFPHLWRKGWNKAARGMGNRSGFYAFRDFVEADNHCCGESKCVVRLELAGKIAIHERGYRAEYAKIAEFMTPGFTIKESYNPWTDALIVEKNRWWWKHDNH